jgi:2-amino-4-hydroxy-6-hydroxymethyldihydropteridine diphosphokinase
VKSLSDELKMRSWDEAVVVALGSNLRGSYASLEILLEAALGALGPQGLKVAQRSSWWRSAAWPDPSQPAYLNGVAIVETQLGPSETLAALRRVEAQFGRVRGEKNASRTLDLDLVAYGWVVMETEALTLPHPRAAERRFVMGPLAEIAPGWVHPVRGTTAEALATSASVGADAARDASGANGPASTPR